MPRKITPDMSAAALNTVDWAAIDAATDADVAPEILPVADLVAKALQS